jgi:hypothetical protein
MLAVLAAAYGALSLAGLLWTALSRAFFGTMAVCAAGGPECHTSVAEPADFLDFVPLFLVFAVPALGSLAGGLLALRRPMAGAVVLFIVGALGAATIFLFVLPLWTPLDLIAAGLALVSALQRPRHVDHPTRTA